MPVQFTLPLFENKPASVKDMVFSILVNEFPLSLIQLHNAIRDRYHKQPSFQAVRKATLQLITEKVLLKEGKKFAISKDWILNETKCIDMLKKQYFQDQKAYGTTKIEVGSNVSVFNFSKLLDLDAFWNGIIREHFASKPTPPKVITFEAAHFWFVVVTLAQETELTKELIDNGIKLYYTCYGNTLLDMWTVKHYQNIGMRCQMMPKPKDFKQGYSIGTFGDLVISTTHPPEIATAMDQFFKRYKRIEDANMTEIFNIVTKPAEITLTVIKDPSLAKNIRENAIKTF